MIPHPPRIPAAADPGPFPAADPGDPAPVRCFTKRSLADYLGLSVRSLDRAAAAGLLPPADLFVGRSPRYSPETISKWLRTRPRLPGRGKGGDA
jgi:hypothetical protein